MHERELSTANTLAHHGDGDAVIEWADSSTESPDEAVAGFMTRHTSMTSAIAQAEAAVRANRPDLHPDGPEYLDAVNRLLAPSGFGLLPPEQGN